MQFYKFDKYYINNGIELIDGYLYDKRIDSRIELNEYCYDVIESIFRLNKVSSVIKHCNIDKQVLRYHLEFLYNNDILSVNRFFSKKSFYTNNIVKTIIKSSCLFYLRTSIFIFLIQIIFNLSLLESFMYWNMLTLTILFHEIGHGYTYYILSKRKTNIYINVNKFDFEVVTPLISGLKLKIIAVMGPIIGMISAICIFFIFREKIILIFIIFHLLQLTPFFKDGKNLWNSIILNLNSKKM